MQKHTKILLVIFLLALGFRLYFAFQTPYFDYDAYFNLRQIDHITETGTPIFQDSLSYGGRTNLFMPTFNYLLAFFNLFLPLVIVAKIIPNILAASLIFIIYLITKKLTNNQNIALLTSFFSAFLPLFITQTFNTVSAYSLTIPLMFLGIYFLMNIEKKKFTYYFITLIFILSLIHSSALLLVAGLLTYLVLTKIEKVKQERKETELILFATFLTIWIQFLVFKNAFLSHGLAIIWQNVPSQLLSSYFTPIDTLGALLKIGLLPLVCGIYIIYRYLFQNKNKEIYLITSFIISTTVLLWFKLISPALCLTIIGILLTILFAQFYTISNTYFKKTKASSYRKYLTASFIIIFLLTSVVPSFYFTDEEIKNTPDQETIMVLDWLRENTPQNTTILATPKQGYIINTVANRKNVIDINFLLTKNPSQRLTDVQTIYKTYYKTEAVTLLNKYNVDYILISPQLEKEFDITTIRYIEDENCFKPIFQNNVSLYQSLCKVQETR